MSKPTYICRSCDEPIIDGTAVQDMAGGRNVGIKHLACLRAEDAGREALRRSFADNPLLAHAKGIGHLNG